MTRRDTEAMTLHLAEIATQIAPGRPRRASRRSLASLGPTDHPSLTEINSRPQLNLGSLRAADG
jgi:hypothetical protein